MDEQDNIVILSDDKDSSVIIAESHGVENEGLAGALSEPSRILNSSPFTGPIAISPTDLKHTCDEDGVDELVSSPIVENINRSPSIPRAKRMRDIFSSSSSQPSSPASLEHCIEFGRNTFDNTLNELRGKTLTCTGTGNIQTSTSMTSTTPKFILPDSSPSRPTSKVKNKMTKTTKMTKNEEKKWQKELESVNRNQTSKNAITEIIVEASNEFLESNTGKTLCEIYEPMGIEILRTERNFHVEDYQCRQIIFKRKVTSKYDSEQDLRIPCPLFIEKQETTIIHMEASHLLELLQKEQKHWDAHVKFLGQLSCKFQVIIYLVEGYAAIKKKLSAEKNRQLSNKVREIMGENDKSGSSQTAKRKRKTDLCSDAQSEPVPEKVVSIDNMTNILDRLHIEKGLRIVYSKDSADSSKWIADLTVAIAAFPYAVQSSVGDIDIGRVKSGKTTQDALLQSLQHIKYVTPPIAEAVSSQYPNANSLIAALVENGPTLLDGLQRNVRGSSRQRSVGPSLAKTLHTIFTSYDPHCFLSGT